MGAPRCQGAPAAHDGRVGSMLQHKPVFLDGEPIGCAATKEQAIALVDERLGAEITVIEEPLAFHLTRQPARAGTHKEGPG